jgi:hypothetical protein
MSHSTGQPLQGIVRRDLLLADADLGR